MQKKKNGFTLVELVIIIVVIGILFTISAVGYSGWQQSINETKLKNEFTMAASALKDYQNFNNAYPTQEEFARIYTSSSDVNFIYDVGIDNKTYSLTATTDDGTTYTADNEDTTPRRRIED